MSDKVRQRPPVRLLILALALATLVGIVIVPVAKLVSVAAEEATALSEVGFGAPWNTLWTSALVTILAVSGGLAAALATEHWRIPGRRWIRFGVLAPLLIPPFVAAVSWARAYGPGGLLDDVLGVSFTGVFGPAGVVAVIFVNVLPIAYLLMAAALATRATPQRELAARVSGAGPAAAFRDVTFPLLRRAMLGSGALVFVLAINAFGVPAVLGLPAGFRTVTTRIYQDLAFSADPAAFSRSILLACGLLLAALIVVGPADLLSPVGIQTRNTGEPSVPVTTGMRLGRLGTSLFLLYFLVSTAVPLLSLVLSALTKAVGVAPTPDNWTLANFSGAVSGRFTGALSNTLLLAVLAATAVVALGAMLVWVGRGRFGAGLGTVALATFAFPGSTLAVGVLLAYGGWLRDTLLLILVAYLAKFWAIGHRAVAGAIDGIGSNVGHAARVSGAGTFATLRTVTIPLMRPAIGAAWLVVFLFAAHELTMSSLLYGPGSETVAVVVLNLQQLGDLPGTSALAVILTVPPLIAGSAYLVLSGRRQRAAR